LAFHTGPSCQTDALLGVLACIGRPPIQYRKQLYMTSLQAETGQRYYQSTIPGVRLATCRQSRERHHFPSSSSNQNFLLVEPPFQKFEDIFIRCISSASTVTFCFGRIVIFNSSCPDSKDWLRRTCHSWLSLLGFVGNSNIFVFGIRHYYFTSHI
jgi:hypothetical protein